MNNQMLAGAFLSILLSSIWIARSFVNPCSSDPCDCNDEEEDPYCSICHSNGCDLCESGYFKADYNYPCVQCQATFGNECLHCQDFDGCGQCSSDYVRTYDATSDLYYCALDTDDDSVTVQIADATFNDDYDTTTSFVPTFDSDSPDDPFDTTNFNVAPSALDLLQLSKAYDVDYDTSEQYETTYSQTFLSNLIANDWFNTELISSGSNDTNNTFNNETDIGCDCSLYCNETDIDNNNNSGNRRNMIVFWPDNRIESTWPYNEARWVGLLRSDQIHGGCSAALIGPNYILTAAHCVHGGGIFGSWYTHRVFYAAKTRNFAGREFRVRTCRAWNGWMIWRNADWNIAVCSLDTSNTGLGWFRFRNAVGSGLNTNDYIRVRGYPGDKLYGTQWWTYGTVWEETASQIRSRNYDAEGMGGSPIYKINSGPTIYGIHNGIGIHWFKTWWLGQWKFYFYNRGTKINTYLYASICQFIGKNWKNC